MLVATDTNLCVNQSTTLRLTGYNGSISWQRRPVGNASWNSVSEFGSEITLSFTGSGSWEYRAIVQILPNCADSSNSLTLRISNFSDIPEPGYGGSICGNTFSLDAENLTGYWEQISGPGVATFSPSRFINNPAVTVDAYGIYDFAWNISNGICTKGSMITMELIEQPIANAGGNFNQCGRSFNLNAEFSTLTSTGSWARVSGPLVIWGDQTNPKTSISSNTGILSLRWRENNNGCEDDDTVIINIADQPTATAGTDANECGLSSTLGANYSLTGYWKLISGPADTIYLTPNWNTNSAIATAETYGSYEMQWRVENSFCADSDTVVINFYEQPIASPLAINDTCGPGALLQASTSALSGGNNVVRSWSYFTGPATPVSINEMNDSSASVLINENFYGNYTFRWIERNADCADTADVSFRLYEIPNPDAGVDAENCGNTYTLQGEGSVNGSLSNWRSLDEPLNITFSDATDDQSNVTANLYGLYRLIFTETNGICSANDTVAVDFIQIPTPEVGGNADTCGFRYQLTARQSLTNSTGEWFLIGTNDSVSLAKGFNALATVTKDSTYSYLFIETNRVCPGSDTKQITYYLQPVAQVLEAEDACGTEQTVIINPPANANTSWRVSEGVTVVPQAQTGRYLVQVENFGEFELNWQVYNSQCSDDTTIALAFFEEPVLELANHENVCNNTTELFYSLSAGIPQWRSQGPGNVNFVNLNNSTARATTATYGYYLITLTGLNGACEVTDNTGFEFIQPPVSNAGSNSDICGPGVSLNASPQTGNWVVVTGAGQMSFNPSQTSALANVQVNRYGNYELQWIARNEECTDTSTVILSFFKQPEAFAGEDQYLNNQFETTMQANSPTDGESGEWTLLSGNDQLSSVSNPTATVSMTGYGNHFFIWTLQNDDYILCSSSDSVLISIADIEIPEVITPNGDGANDYFYITGIDDVDRVEVSIMNRWGIEVFYSRDYQNNWDGTNSNGEFLTNDTYFYLVNVPNRSVMKGFVVLKR